MKKNIATIGKKTTKRKKKDELYPKKKNEINEMK